MECSRIGESFDAYFHFHDRHQLLQFQTFSKHLPSYLNNVFDKKNFQSHTVNNKSSRNYARQLELSLQQATVSSISVMDSVLNMSLGAGTKNQMKLGIIMIRNSTAPQISNPILYFLNIFQTPIYNSHQISFTKNLFIHSSFFRINPFKTIKYIQNAVVKSPKIFYQIRR